MNNIARRLALPLLSAGFIGGAALGLAGTASAEVSTTTTNGHHAIVATPDTKAKPPVQADSHYGHRHHHNNPWR